MTEKSQAEREAVADALDAVRVRFTVAAAINGTAYWNAVGARAAAGILKAAAELLRKEEVR